jgi:metal-responsive CopG/Arc/MetJ family transcriptional regulator
MNIQQLKKPYKRAVKKSVSMPEMLYDQADSRRRAHQLTTFSDYIQTLIRKDVAASQERAVA